MARTVIPLNVLAANSSIAAPTPTGIDQVNGMSVTYPPSTAIPASPGSELCFLVVANTSGAQHNVLIRTASFTAGAIHGFPDLSIPVGAGATRWIGPLDSGRYVTDDMLIVDFDSGFSGTVTASVLPMHW